MTDEEKAQLEQTEKFLIAAMRLIEKTGLLEEVPHNQRNWWAGYLLKQQKEKTNVN